ncbi:MAG: tetratricopeptide repeat protein [Woeseiaceae bacterium]|nr:tetratricopeptide repeat protein [Woeseiaceae bacterium]
MYKLSAVMLFAFLAGSSAGVYVVMSPTQTTVTVPGEIVEQHVTAPVTQRQWIDRQTMRSVPAFATGTPVDDVRSAIIEQNLTILGETPDYILIKEGVPLIDLSGPMLREKFVYGFDNGGLSLGPLTYDELASYFEDIGLTADHLDLLHLVVVSDPDDLSNYNELAWLLATHPDSALRRPQVAVDLAVHAVDNSVLDEWAYIDTLAAAYAAAGDFGNAVLYQEQAIEASAQTDVAAIRRLKLYRDDRIYTQDLRYDEQARSDNGVQPRRDLLEQAAAGSVDAQWRLAVFYLENGIEYAEGTEYPGGFWLMQAAENGHMYAINEVGYCLLLADTCGLGHDPVAAAKWFRRGVEMGDTEAAFNLGRMLAYGIGTPRNDPEATQLLRIAADTGLESAAYLVAARYGEGVGEPPNYSLMSRYQKMYREAGYRPADYLLDDIFFNRFYGGTAVAGVLDRTGVSDAEMPAALLTIADLILEASDVNGETFEVRFTDDTVVEYPVEHGRAIAVTLVRVAAGLGSSEAQLEFAEMYETGTWVPRSLPEAHYWRERAAR